MVDTVNKAGQAENPDAGLSAKQIWDSESKSTTSSDDDPALKPVAPMPEAPAEPVVPAATAPVAKDEDIYAGLHPEVAKRLKDADAFSTRLRQAEGHIGGLNNALKQQKEVNERLSADLSAATKAAAKTGVATPGTAAVAAAGQDSDKWKALRDEFPEWAEAVDERLRSQAPPDIDALREQIGKEITEGLTTKLTADIKASIAGETESRLVNIAHRGWLATVKTQAFTDWMGKQSPEIQALGASPVAEDAIDLLDRFKESQATLPPPVDPGKVMADRQARLKEAAGMQRGAANLAPVKSTDDMSAEELWAFEAAQLEKKKAKR